MPLPRGPGHPKFSTTSGVAVLSRLPLHRPRALFPAGPDRPAIAVEVETAAGPLTLGAAHPSKPLSPAGLELRDRYLMGLVSALADSRGPLVLAGDFNATPYTPIFRRLRSDLGLSPGPKLPATYPAGFGPLGLAIDHVLIRGARFDRLEPLAARGSDHRGLYARLSLPSVRGQAP
jgi:endonuclease/exonuclease/phosphatase (EEP) superfamily protein YafD